MYSHKSDKIPPLRRLLSDLIKIPSVAPHEAEIALYLQKWLIEHGFTVELAPIESIQRWNMFAGKNLHRITKRRRPILFYGHLDTVPPDPQWINPFKPKYIYGRLFGLGSYDMKGGMAAFLIAASKAKCPVKIFLAVDEERISLGAWEAITKNRQFFSDVRLIISAEPNFGLGLSGITLGRAGRVVFDLNIRGKAAHLAKQEQAIDAIELLNQAMSALYAAFKTSFFLSKHSTGQIRQIRSETNGLSVCARASCKIEVLFSESDTIVRVKNKIHRILWKNKKLMKRFELEVAPRLTPYLPFYHFRSFPRQKKVARIIKKYCGKPMTLHRRTSVGDDNVLATLKIPIITWGPDGGNAHNAREYVDMESLINLEKMYEEVLSIGSTE